MRVISEGREIWRFLRFARGCQYSTVSVLDGKEASGENIDFAYLMNTSRIMRMVSDFVEAVFTNK